MPVFKGRNISNQYIYNLLVRIDVGYLATEDEKQMLKSITSVVWENYKFAKLPNSIGMLESLKKLDLRYCSVNDISILVNLPNLSSLCLYSTEISDISVMPNLTLMSELDLSCTKVSDISALSKMTSLVELDLSRTNVSNISALANLSSLSKLDLSETNVRDISALSGLTDLKALNLNGIEIDDLNAISGLTALDYLELQNSKTAAIPESFLDLNLSFITEQNIYITHKKGINICGLTLTDQPIEIFSQGIELIRAYYREKNTVPVNECKVIFLGDAESGKTHSIRRLLNNGEILENFDGETTHGIETTVSRIKLEESEITINYWDFGGQEIQHSMHRVFLTERTVYVVFLNASQDERMDEKARYWLENIKVFAPDAPVLVVINKIDQNEHPRFNEKGFLEAYGGQVKKVIRLSAKTDKPQAFLNKLQGNINSIVMELPTVSKKIPRSWKELMENIRGMEEHYLTTDQFIEKCKSNRIKDYKDIHDELVDLFQVIGVSFCYYKDRSIADYMLLSPRWMLNALYTIVTNGKVVARNGVISQDDLYDLLQKDTINGASIKRVIPELRYKGFEINFILGVIRMFSLSYRLEDGSEFFPMLCDGDEKISVKEVVPENALHFIFRYTYLPTNVMHRLVVEMQRDLDYQYVWYTGAVFRNELQNQSAYIHTLGNDLHIYAYGEEEYYNLNEYLTPIINRIRYINRYIGISVEEYLTCRSKSVEVEIPFEDVIGNLRNKSYTTYNSKLKKIIDFRIESRRYINEYPKKDDELLQTIIKALQTMQNDMTYYRTPENSRELENRRNRFVSEQLGMAGYICGDQQTGGTSLPGKAPGIRDIVVKDKNGMDFLIYEGLNQITFDKSIINSHITKLLVNYNPMGLRQSILVTYLECDRDKFKRFTDEYKKQISGFAPELYRCAGEPKEIASSGQFLSCMVMNYEAGGIYFVINHIVVRVAP